MFGIVGLVAGILVGVFFLKRGYSLGRNLNRPSLAGDLIQREDQVMSNGSRLSPGMRERTVRLVFDQVKDNEPTWPAIVTESSKIDTHAVCYGILVHHLL